MLNKMLTDFAVSPGNTRFVIVLPKWTSAPWWSLLRHFEQLHEYPTGARIFTAPSNAMFATAKLTPAGDQGGLGRFFISGTPWPVVVMMKGINTPCQMDEDDVLFHMRAGHPGERESKLLAANYNTDLSSTMHGAHVEHCPACPAG